MKENNEKIKVHFYDEVQDELLKFAVIFARAEGKWVFCRHRDRDTWECPGGHREPGENIDETARRELYEETGAAEYTITPLCVYSVEGGGNESFGKLYYGEISEFGALPPLEIERIELFAQLPEDWTYPDIQPILLEEVIRRIKRIS